jgi:hypothetical protein
MAYVAPDNSREQWTRILIFVAVVVVVAILFFDFTAEATPRPWAMSSCNKANLSKTHPTSIGVEDLVKPKEIV